MQDAQYYRLGGGGSYAAQTFSGIDDRRIKVAWGQMEAPDACFTSQMNFPTEVRLDCVDGKYRLATLPIAEIAQLRTDTRTWEKTASVSNPLIDYLNGGAYEITIRFGKACAAMTVELYGLRLRILPEENILELPGRVLPLSYNYSGREVRLIIDTMSMEVFSDEGRIYTAVPCLPELQNRQFTLVPVKPMQVCEVAVSISPSAIYGSNSVAGGSIILTCSRRISAWQVRSTDPRGLFIGTCPDCPLGHNLLSLGFGFG